MMSAWRTALVVRHQPRHLLQAWARPQPARRAASRTAASVSHSDVDVDGGQDAAGGDVDDSIRCSLDAFITARGAAGLLGWDVILHDSGAAVGTVAEVLSAAGGEVVFDVSGGGTDTPDVALDPLADLLVLGALPGADDTSPENVLLRVQGVGRQYQWHVFVPLVSALVPALEPQERRVRISPPAGLLELGERPHLLAWLKQQLQPYLGPLPSGGTSGARPQRMPGRSELLRQERGDLVDSIARAGGFAAVGAQLRLRGARKPPGYWDDVDILASELREFVDSHWTEHSEPGPGEQVASDPYWYNDISGQLRWDPPPKQREGRGTDGGDDEDAFEDDGDGDDDDFTTDLVMPPLRTLVAGGRWDLASAVRMHGGSRAVASQLGWAPAPRWVGRHLAAFDTLADELRAFCADQEAGEEDEDSPPGLGPALNTDDQCVMPTIAVLRAADRPDLLEAVRRHGGVTAVAARLGWRLERSPKGRWASPAVTAREVRAFLRARGKTGTPNRLPTRAELTAAGRHDLAYALSLHGTKTVAAKLKLAPRRAVAARPFGSAREFAHALRLRTVADWQAWCRTGARPPDIPSNPAVSYKDGGWAGWTDFLAGTPTGSVPVKRRQRRSAAAVSALAQAIASAQTAEES